MERRIQISSASGPTSVSIRSRISRAALFVKVIASTFHGATPFHQVNTQYDVLTHVSYHYLHLPLIEVVHSLFVLLFVAVDLNRLIIYLLIYACTYSPFTALTVLTPILYHHK